MFCPKCGGEYVDGIIRCPKCEVPLTEELPQNKKSQMKAVFVPLVTVFATDDVGLTAIAKSLLDGAGIKYFAKGEMLQGILPINIGGFNAVVEIQVRQNEAEDARELLKGLK